MVASNMGRPEKVSRKEWMRRAMSMLQDNLALQKYGKSATEALVEIHKIACSQHDKLRLLIMPGVKDSLDKIANLAGPFAVKVPEVEFKKEDPNAALSGGEAVHSNGVVGKEGK